MAGLQWNDPEERKTRTIPAASTSVILPPSPRKYGSVRPEDTNTTDYILPPVPDLISGPAKMLIGGAGAIPTAIGKGIEQIPTGIGKLIGAVPINPPDYGVNKPLDLAAQGATEFAGGMRRLGTAARTGAMNLFGLKEAPVTSPSAPVASTLPAAAQPFAPPVASPLPVAAQPFAPSGVTPSPVVAGKGIQPAVQPSQPVATPALPARDFNKEIDDLVDTLMKDPSSKVVQSMGLDKSLLSPLSERKEVFRTGGLKKNVLNQIVELKKAQLGLAGHEIQVGGAKATAEASKLATREEAALNRAERKRAAEERIRMDVKELEQRRTAGEDTRLLRERMDKEDKFQKSLTKYGEDSITGFNAGKGLFEMGFQGMHADRPEVQQAYLPFKTRLEKALGGRPPTPQQLKMAKEAWYKDMGWTM